MPGNDGQQRRKPTPEELLRRVEAEESYQRRGKLKVFLGYASGVGKSFRMLDEGRRRKTRGQDVVVAATQPGTEAEQPSAVSDLLQGLEVIPMRSHAIDVDAVKRRHPGVCLIDGLAFHNPAGSRNADRWQDVEELLAAGISVVTTINLQFIREKQTQVEAIRGKRVTDSVPESFLRKADDIEVVDAPPEYCVDRTEGGTNLLEQQLSELREIALLLAAEVVDLQLDSYLRRHGIEQAYGTHERILVCITPRSNAELMIGRGRRQADRFHGELFVAYVEQPELGEADQATLEHNLAAAREANAQVAILHGEDPVAAILRFAEGHGVTQIFVGHSQRSGFWQRFRPNPVERLILESSGIDIRIFPQGLQR
jgi:two-component system, OmpR family, sensor histidine kinase KdpD